MQTKSVLYAAVGAPVVAVRKISSRMSDIKGKVGEGTATYGKAAEEAIESWAVEGEKVMARVGDGKVVEEIDQAKEQVSKLRHQLEDMVATWRTSFRPAEAPSAKAEEEMTEPKEAKKAPEAKKPAAKKPAAKKPAAKKAESDKPSAEKKKAEAAAAETTTAKAAEKPKAGEAAEKKAS